MEKVIEIAYLVRVAIVMRLTVDAAIAHTSMSRFKADLWFGTISIIVASP